MNISPPIAISAIVAVALASTAWLEPPRREVARVTLMLPTATYQKLALWGKEHSGADGRPLTVVQVVGKLIINREKNHESSALRPGARGRSPLFASQRRSDHEF